MDLADFLSFKATGNCARSICTVTCKWMYDGSWDPTFWESIGLSELTNNNYQQIGEPESILQVGESAGTVTKEFSDATGLSIDTIVAVALLVPPVTVKPELIAAVLAEKVKIPLANNGSFNKPISLFENKKVVSAVLKQ